MNISSSSGRALAAVFGALCVQSSNPAPDQDSPPAPMNGKSDIGVGILVLEPDRRQLQGVSSSDSKLRPGCLLSCGFSDVGAWEQARQLGLSYRSIFSQQSATRFSPGFWTAFPGLWTLAKKHRPKCLARWTALQRGQQKSTLQGGLLAKLMIGTEPA
ncbi:hypothetical protein [Stutzerimonas nitrititolerans]|uniref:hypothetical protein n=1 Tax=Stutzerimonas nitrititolerans TaxID=2482751 RepID=UPI0028B178F4|nr:hypothetical protein [Stutzerimonas nitrititolerans]